jgi:hypothetical protein
VQALFALRVPFRVQSKEKTMTNNLNRGRLSVSLGDGWRNHARMIPAGITPIGLVTRKGLTHSLGIDASGDYWAFGTGKPEKLVRLKVQSAIAAIKTGMHANPLPSENEA